MATSFPTAIDNFVNPTPVDDLDTPAVLHTDEHSNANDALEAIETKVGIDGSADQATIDYILHFHVHDSSNPDGSNPVFPISINGQSIEPLGIYTIPPSGPAGAGGGDLGGSYPDPFVVWINGYSTYDARYVLKAGDTMTGALVIVGSADVVQLTVVGNATQTANLQEWQDSANNVLTKIEANGDFFTGLNAFQKVSISSVPTGTAYAVDCNFNNGISGDGVFKTAAVKNDTVGGGFLAGALFSVLIDTSAGHQSAQIIGGQFAVRKTDDGNLGEMEGGIFICVNGDAGHIFDMYGCEIIMENLGGSATVGNLYSLHVSGLIINGNVVTNNYGIKVEDQTLGSNNWSLYTGKGNIRILSDPAVDTFGMWGIAGTAQQTVTGSQGGNTALASLLSILVGHGLILDTSTP